MDGLIVAFETEKNRKKLCDMLEQDGIAVDVGCASGAAVLRACHTYDSAVIVCGYKLADMAVGELSELVPLSASILLIGTAVQLDMCEPERVSKLCVPIRKSDLTASVRMLRNLALRKKACSGRSEDEQRAIIRAKVLLMNRNHMSEKEAHRFLQKYSMDHGLQMYDVACTILNA